MNEEPSDNLKNKFAELIAKYSKREMNIDLDGEIINGKMTYRDIAGELKLRGSCVIGWTDEIGSHFDILFVNDPIMYGVMQGGLRRGDKRNLFVSIMRLGAFGSDINTKSHWNYYNEKLGNRFGKDTGEKFGELINGVKKYLVGVKD